MPIRLNRRYQRTASTISSGGNRNPANADVGGRHGRERVNDLTAQACLDHANAQRNGPKCAYPSKLAPSTVWEILREAGIDPAPDRSARHCCIKASRALGAADSPLRGSRRAAGGHQSLDGADNLDSFLANPIDQVERLSRGLAGCLAANNLDARLVQQCPSADAVASRADHENGPPLRESTE